MSVIYVIDSVLKKDKKNKLVEQLNWYSIIIFFFIYFKEII